MRREAFRWLVLLAWLLLGVGLAYLTVSVAT